MKQPQKKRIETVHEYRVKQLHLQLFFPYPLFDGWIIASETVSSHSILRALFVEMNVLLAKKMRHSC